MIGLTLRLQDSVNTEQIEVMLVERGILVDLVLARIDQTKEPGPRATSSSQTCLLSS